MKQFLIIAFLFAALSISCYSTKESCPTIYKNSKLTLHEHVIMYEHVVECCGVEKKFYGTYADMIHEWIKMHPTIMIYYTFWGSFEWKSLCELYLLHALCSSFIFGLCTIFVEENMRPRG